MLCVLSYPIPSYPYTSPYLQIWMREVGSKAIITSFARFSPADIPSLGIPRTLRGVRYFTGFLPLASPNLVYSQNNHCVTLSSSGTSGSNKPFSTIFSHLFEPGAPTRSITFSFKFQGGKSPTGAAPTFVRLSPVPRSFIDNLNNVPDFTQSQDDAIFLYPHAISFDLKSLPFKWDSECDYTIFFIPSTLDLSQGISAANTSTTLHSVSSLSSSSSSSTTTILSSTPTSHSSFSDFSPPPHTPTSSPTPSLSNATLSTPVVGDVTPEDEVVTPVSVSSLSSSTRTLASNIFPGNTLPLSSSSSPPPAAVAAAAAAAASANNECQVTLGDNYTYNHHEFSMPIVLMDAYNVTFKHHEHGTVISATKIIIQVNGRQSGDVYRYQIRDVTQPLALIVCISPFTFTFYSFLVTSLSYSVVFLHSQATLGHPGCSITASTESQPIISEQTTHTGRKNWSDLQHNTQVSSLVDFVSLEDGQSFGADSNIFRHSQDSDPKQFLVVPSGMEGTFSISSSSTDSNDVGDTDPSHDGPTRTSSPNFDDTVTPGEIVTPDDGDNRSAAAASQEVQYPIYRMDVTVTLPSRDAEASLFITSLQLSGVDDIQLTSRGEIYVPGHQAKWIPHSWDTTEHLSIIVNNNDHFVSVYSERRLLQHFRTSGIKTAVVGFRGESIGTTFHITQLQPFNESPILLPTK